MTATHAHDILTEAFDYAIEELNGFLARIQTDRVLVVERESAKHWVARIDDDRVLYRSPDGNAVWRFARTFAARNPGVALEGEDWVAAEHSVRVPDNVVPIGGREQA